MTLTADELARRLLSLSPKGATSDSLEDKSAEPKTDSQ